MKELLQTLVAAVCGGLMAYFNVLLIPLVVLVAVMLIDYCTGMASAFVCKKLNSRIGIKGIFKKLGYLVLVCVGGVVDYLMISGLGAIGIHLQTSFYVGLIVTIWLIINELISILENLSCFGVRLPDFLMKLLSRLKNNVENKTESR